MKLKDIDKMQQTIKHELQTNYQAQNIENIMGRWQCQINTRYGVLNITMHAPSPSTIVSVFSRFETPSAETAYFTGCNPYSGKINFHEWSCEALLNQFMRFVSCVYEPLEIAA